jgi:hypothetical protein
LEPNKFGNRDEVVAFYKKAFEEIYTWLPDEKKDKLNFELRTEGLYTFAEGNEKERFFFILNFFEINYVKPIDWAKQSIESLRKIGEIDARGNLKKIRLELDEQTDLEEASKWLSESGLKELFYSTLEQMDLKGEYEYYIQSKKGLKTNE